jgi:hypothetical protein
MQNANAVKRIVAEMTLVRMCDEALDTSSEALLARIAKLEEQVALGAIAPRETAPASAEQSAPKAQQVEPVREKTAPVPEKATPVSQKVPAVAPTSDKRVLRPIRSWMEVVERIGRSDPMEAGFVKEAKAYTLEDDRVLVRFERAFGLQMMEKGDARDRLRMAISAVLRREVGDRKLLMELVDQNDARSLIDEIIDEE